MKGGSVRDYKDEGGISQRLQIDPGLSTKERRLKQMMGGLARDSMDEGRISQRLQLDLGLPAKERRLTEMKGGLARDSKDEGRIQRLQLDPGLSEGRIRQPNSRWKVESVSDSPSFIFANPLSFTDNPRWSWSLCLTLPPSNL